MMKRNLILYGAPESDKNILYATHFNAPDAFCYVQYEGKSHLFVSDLELERAKIETTIDHIHSITQLSNQLALSGDAKIVRILYHMFGKSATCAFEVPQDFPLYYADQLRQVGFELHVKLDPFFPERVLKTDLELENIQSVETSVSDVYREIEAIFQETRIIVDQLIFQGQPLTSERIKEHIFFSLYKKECLPSGTIVSCGIDTAYPHNQGSGLLKPHQFIIIDIFPRSIKHHYFGDMTRTFVVGEPTSAMLKQYEAVEKAQAWALQQIKPGADTWDIHSGIESIFGAAGFKTEPIDGILQGFMHGTGHGVGLDIHEAPRINSTSTKLEAGQVITIEPGLYYLKTGGVRIEDLGVVTANGFTNFSQYPKSLTPFPGQ